MIDIWKIGSEDDTYDFRVAPDEMKSVREMLLKEGIEESEFEVIIPDVQVAIDHQIEKDDTSNAHRNVLSSGQFFDRYHTLEEIEGYIDDLVSRYTKIV